MQKLILNVKNDVKTFFLGINIVKKVFGKHYLYLKYFQSILSSISPYITVYMAGNVITLLTQKANLDVLYRCVISVIVINFSIDLIANIVKRKCSILESAAPFKHEALLTQKALSLDYAKAEDPKIVSLRAQIAENSNTKGTGVMWLAKSSSEILSGIVSIIVAVFMIIQLYNASIFKGNSFGLIINSPVFTVVFTGILFVLIFMIIVANQKNSTTIFKAYDSSSGIDSFLDYYSEKILNENVAGKDIRIFGEESLIKEELIRTIIKPLKKSREKIFKSNVTYGLIPAIITVLMGGLIYSYVGLKALSGSIEVGKVVEFYGIITNLVVSLTVLATQCSYLKSNNSYLNQELEYFRIPSNVSKGSRRINEIDLNKLTVTFRNVYFKYPGTENYVLKNFSAEFLPGEKTAIVGMNGSGKSTIIKLLCRLYDVCEGEILLNNINIREFNIEEYQNLFSVVFQDFDLFAFSVGENVAAAQEYDSKKIWEKLEQAGIKKRIEEFPLGLNQSLYKSYNDEGIDISGGEGQKIAIARALYKDSPIVILDEPTASLDPIAESEIYLKFNELSENKNTIFISHRLSSCKFCDKILVLKNGQLIEKGTHEELLFNGIGEYVALWQAQAQHYQ